MTQKNFEISGGSLIKALSRNLLEGTEENQKNMSQKQGQFGTTVIIKSIHNIPHKRTTRWPPSKRIFKLSR
jgi:hypothetical protein